MARYINDHAGGSQQGWENSWCFQGLVPFPMSEADTSKHNVKFVKLKRSGWPSQAPRDLISDVWNGFGGFLKSPASQLDSLNDLGACVSKKMQDHIPWKTWCSDFITPPKTSSIFFSPRNLNKTKSWIPPQRNPPSRERRALVVALRDISCGEEIYAFYGEGYWRARWAPRFHVQSNLISDSFLFVEIFEDSFLQSFFWALNFLLSFRVIPCTILEWMNALFHMCFSDLISLDEDEAVFPTRKRRTLCATRSSQLTAQLQLSSVDSWIVNLRPSNVPPRNNKA